MGDVILRHEDQQVVFDPDRGMNMMSFKKAGIEAMDQNTAHLFKERYAGLGALIGPHFHRRKAETISPVPHEERFPFIAGTRAKGVQEPFSHGIARYAPWKTEVAGNKVTARLSSKDVWNEIPLEILEGQKFEMTLSAELGAEGLKTHYTIVSDFASVLGFHYYYALQDRKGVVESRDVRADYRDAEGNKPIPNSWKGADGLCFDLAQDADYGFYPSFTPLTGTILMKTGSHNLQIKYWCKNQENSWQLYHPKGETFVCIEPLTAQNPRKPILSVSFITQEISIL